MSYGESATLKEKKFGDHTVSIEAGSYNPGNTPEYGKEWEYITVEATKWTGNSGTTVWKKGVRNMTEANQLFETKCKEYAGTKLHASGQIRHLRCSCKGKVFKAGKKRYVLIKKGKQVKLKTYDPKLFQKVWMRNPKATVKKNKNDYEIIGLRIEG
jgi:hypothetical protein